jgi:hypothetical protein
MAEAEPAVTVSISLPVNNLTPPGRSLATFSQPVTTTAAKTSAFQPERLTTLCKFICLPENLAGPRRRPLIAGLLPIRSRLWLFHRLQEIGLML